MIKANIEGFLKSFHTRLNGIDIKEIQEYQSHVESIDRMIGTGLPTVLAIINLHTLHYEYLSPNYGRFFGEKAYQRLKREGVKSSFQDQHPEDRKIIQNSVYPTIHQTLKKLSPSQKLRAKGTYNFRFKKNNGAYGHYIQSNIILKLNIAGDPLLDFGFITEVAESSYSRKIELCISLLNEENIYETILEKDFPIFQPSENLTKREVEITRLIANGYSSKEIAQQLYISTHTVNTHRRNILVKWKMRSMTEVVNFAKEISII